MGDGMSTRLIIDYTFDPDRPHEFFQIGDLIKWQSSVSTARREMAVVIEVVETGGGFAITILDEAGQP